MISLGALTLLALAYLIAAERRPKSPGARCSPDSPADSRSPTPRGSQSAGP